MTGLENELVAMTATRRRGKSNQTLKLQAAIHEIVKERAPITVRGVCYGLFVAGLIPGMDKNSTAKISRVMTEMREADVLDWRLIVDDSRVVSRSTGWRDPSQIIQAAVDGYRRDHWQGQPFRVEVWSEKATVHGVLAPVLRDFGVTFRPLKGFGSHTALRQAAEDSFDVAPGQEAVALYLGDFDPSGIHMSMVDIPQQLQRYGSEWEFRRIAITEADTRGLPSFPAATKKDDARHRWYVDRFGQDCWELDAMDPVALRARVREQIRSYLNLPAWEHSIKIESVETESMRDFHAAWKQQLSAHG
jgi:hypothetical protein